jgi:hypothetical protein
MKLYKIERVTMTFTHYDAFTSAIVVAPTPEEAKLIHPRVGTEPTIRWDATLEQWDIGRDSTSEKVSVADLNEWVNGEWVAPTTVRVTEVRAIPGPVIHVSYLNG